MVANWSIIAIWGTKIILTASHVTKVNLIPQSYQNKSWNGNDSSQSYR